MAPKTVYQKGLPMPPVSLMVANASPGLFKETMAVSHSDRRPFRGRLPSQSRSLVLLLFFLIPNMFPQQLRSSLLGLTGRQLFLDWLALLVVAQLGPNSSSCGLGAATAAAIAPVRSRHPGTWDISLLAGRGIRQLHRVGAVRTLKLDGHRDSKTVRTSDRRQCYPEIITMTSAASDYGSGTVRLVTG